MMCESDSTNSIFVVLQYTGWSRKIENFKLLCKKDLLRNLLKESETCSLKKSSFIIQSKQGQAGTKISNEIR